MLLSDIILIIGSTIDLSHMNFEDGHLSCQMCLKGNHQPQKAMKMYFLDHLV